MTTSAKRKPAAEAPAVLLTNASRDVVGVRLDGTAYPLPVLRRALGHQFTLYQIAEALGFEDASDPAAILARVCELAARSS